MEVSTLEVGVPGNECPWRCVPMEVSVPGCECLGGECPGTLSSDLSSETCSCPLAVLAHLSSGFHLLFHKWCSVV